jgi:uncharacterized protein YdeI (YjbR/CyaY-like superfamily)
MEPKFFATPAEWRKWLEQNHDKEKELLVSFYKKESGKPSITWPESVDAALCFGWIDGVRRSVDESSYSIRFTPRKSRSIWSAVNTRRMRELMQQGLVHPAGLKAFEARDEKRSGVYSFEQRSAAELSPEQLNLFRANKEAWQFFRAQPPGYQKTTTWWVVSAKREETQRKRLMTLIEDSAAGRRIRGLARPAKS